MARIIGFELIAALGVGLGVQLPLSAVRNVLAEPDVPAGEALVLFSVHLGQTLALPVAQAIFMNTLGRLLATKLPASNVDKMIHLGPSEVNADHMNAEIVPFVTACYSKAVTTAFCVAIAASGLAMIAAVFIEWRKLEQEGAELTGGILSGEPLNDQEGAQNASESTESTELGPVKTTSTSEPPSATSFNKRSGRDNPDPDIECGIAGA
ncbi:hypothetical protein Daus18300_008183 [Diaporthe australafricana]|uniref:Major facilitator superfamily transporter n=1 Tax=Diaporthe australafricana TaxID=127596 RepID=A0ABR3WJ91_9PEZI